MGAEGSSSEVPVPGRNPRATLATMSGAFLAVLVAVIAVGLRTTEGSFTYALDDAYIHLSMARNLVDHGVYGPTRFAYESASSSPLWTLGLAAVAAVVPGALLCIPGVVAGLGALGILAVFAHCQDYVQVRRGRPGLVVAALLLPVLLFLPGLVVGGMEATVWILVVLLICVLFQAHHRRGLGPRQVGLLLGLCAIAPMLRFEALFVAAGCLASTALVPPLRDRRLPVVSARPLSPLVLSALMALVVLGGVAAYAAINVAHGQYPLPNSVMAKSDAGGSLTTLLARVPGKFQNNFLDDGLLAPLLVFGVYLLVQVTRRRSEDGPMVVAFVVITLLHLCLADTGSFLRYQAYLVAIGLLVLLREADSIRTRTNLRGRWQLMGGVVVLTAFAFGLPRFYLTLMAPTAMANIYQQQGQVAAFFATAYPDATVADDDIGLVSYLHRGPLFDLRALGTFEVLRAIKRGQYNRRFIEQAARADGVRVIALHERVVGPLVPPSWIRVAELTEPSTNVVMISSTAILYAPDDADAEVLRARLRAFEPRLPVGDRLHFEPLAAE